MAGLASARARVHAAIKARLLAGAFAFRERIDIDAVARDLAVSATPVRMALVRLEDERLLFADDKGAFFVAVWSEAELRALYGWLWLLTRMALAEAPAGVRAGGPDPASSPRALVGALTAEANPNLHRAAMAAEDRLWAARRVEGDVLPGCDRELARLGALAAAPRTRSARAALQRYFARRIGAVADIRARALVAAFRNGTS
jgi:hypothetical protein